MNIEYDFNGSLPLTEVVEDFFFSPSTGLYVYRHPLFVDNRVLEAADKIGVSIQASPEKWIVNTEFSKMLLVLTQLNSTALSLPQYFKVRRDVIEANDQDMLQSLESDQFIEMLATVFLDDKYMIHHPIPGKKGYIGNKIPVQTPIGRYGWIDPDTVDLETGLPTKVFTHRDLTDTTIKYWDTHAGLGETTPLMTIRGYVTSVGKQSLDLGFPHTAISQKMTIRECRTSLPQGVLDGEILDEAKDILTKYYCAMEDGSLYNSIPGWYKELLDFIQTYKTTLVSANDTASQVLKEDVRDALGVIWIYASLNNRFKIAEEVQNVATSFSGLKQNVATNDSFKKFLKSRKQELVNAIKNHKSIVFVRGHENPDTDTVISAVAESFRQHLLHGDNTVFIPAIPGSKLPAEIAELLGSELSDTLVFTSSEEYQQGSKTGRPEWIMVDHNLGPYQSDTRAIIDHHFPSDVSQRQQIPRRIIFAGSTATLITQRLYGLGIEIPDDLARLLQGAALMDTENRFTGKMTSLDELVMNRLKSVTGIDDESDFYQGLMRKLITCYSADELFVRDYKEDWSFGFAVAKGIGLLDEENSSIIDGLQELALQNNIEKNLPLTLVKVVDYDDDAETIRREIMYCVFGESTDPEFIESTINSIEVVIKFESPKDVKVKRNETSIEYWGVGTQLSRKKLTPVLDPVVIAYNQYFYSPSTQLYFKRDFLKSGTRVKEIADQNGLTLHIDKNGIIVGNPAKLKFYLQELGLMCATPAQYFSAYNDAIDLGDERMATLLTSSSYLEMLNAIIVKHSTMIENPNITCINGKLGYDNKEGKDVHIPAGEPGLIAVSDIDPKTGLPTEVQSPDQYGQDLWRYWSPGKIECGWVLRSTIFAYDIPALDLKFRFDEELPKLSVRPVVKKVQHPKVKVYHGPKNIVVQIDN